jgi:hypothetical protein
LRRDEVAVERRSQRVTWSVPLLAWDAALSRAGRKTAQEITAIHE